MELEIGIYERNCDSITFQFKCSPSENAIFAVEMNGKVLKESFTGTILKKKGLSPKTKYTFRVQASDESKGIYSEWKTLNVFTTEEEILNAPLVASSFTQDNGKFSMLVSWNDEAPLENSTRYWLQMRTIEDSLEWSTISNALKGSTVRKNNIESGNYVFRFCRSSAIDEWDDWSKISIPFITPNFNVEFENALGSYLLRNINEKVSIKSLSGKCVALYFSAHWCPPCRKQIAQMIRFYNEIHKNKEPFEIIFISADRSTQQFNEYFSEMPWLALPYESSMRENLMQIYKISGIPKLMIFSHKDGAKVITDNAAGVPLTPELLRYWMNQ